MEVQLAWLEEDVVAEAIAKAKNKKGRAKPPRLPGAAMTMPPMPATPSRVPPRHNTMEVELDWLEVTEDELEIEAKKALGTAATIRPKSVKASEKPAKASERPAKASERPAAESSEKPARKRYKPIPREEPD